MNKNSLNLTSYGKSFFSLASNATTKISLWHLIIDPFKKLFVNWQLYLILAVPTTILLTISSLTFGRSSLCGLNDLSIAIPNCSENAFDFYNNMFFYFILLVIFAVKWYQFSIEKPVFSFKTFFKLTFNQIKAIGLISLFTLINISPMIGLVILFLRVPNPDWQKELLFFTSVAWIFLLPIIALRFYSLIAFALENKELPSLKKIWNATAGNMLKLLLGTALIVFLALCFFMQYYSSIQSIPEVSSAAMITAEFEYNILTTLFTVLYMNYCYTQKQLFFRGEENE